MDEDKLNDLFNIEPKIDKSNFGFIEFHSVEHAAKKSRGEIRYFLNEFI